MRFHKTSFSFFAAQSHRKAFSLVEVVLAVGVLAVSVLALLGMMGPAFRQAKGVTETNAATAVIGKLNAIIQGADFSDIYKMVEASATGGQNGSPPAIPSQLGIFLFYTEESFDNGAAQTRYRDRVAYFAGGSTINNAGKNGWESLSSLADALDPTRNTGEWRVMPPVIAVVVSLSPIIQDQTDLTGISYTAATPFGSTSRLFPKYTLPSEENYPLGMLPIMASVFVVPNPQDDIISGGSFTSDQVQSFLTMQNRIFTFQAVKLR